jgi:hypothetical protein
MRRVVIVAVVGALSAVFAAAAPSAFAAAHFEGAAPGSVTCQLSVTVKYAPPMTNANAGSVGMTSKAKLRFCHATDPRVHVSPTKFSNTPALTTGNVLNCGSSGSTSAVTALSISWKGSFTGPINGQVYKGRATYYPSTISESGEQLAPPSGTGLAGISMPTDESTTKVLGGGSFAANSDGMTATLYSSYTASQISSMCAKGGIKKMSLSGTITVG